MIIGIVHFPPVRQGKEKEFLEWFAWSNSQFTKQQGFISRRLIKQLGEPNTYVAIIEFDSLDNFKMVSEQPFHDESAQRVAALLEGMPTPILYNTLTV